LEKVALLLLPLCSTHRSPCSRNIIPTRPWIWQRSRPPPPLQGIRLERGIERKTTKKLSDLNLNYSGTHPRPTPTSYSGRAALGGPVNGRKPSRVL
jgi:hypothetical protein